MNTSIETLIRRLDRRAYRHGVLLRPTAALEIAERMLLMNIMPQPEQQPIGDFWNAIPARDTAAAQLKANWARAIMKNKYAG